MQATGGESAVGLGDRLDHMGERHAIGGQPRGIGHHAQRLALAPGNESDTDIIDLGDLGAEPRGELVEVAVVPMAGRAGLGGQRQHHDRHVVDAAQRHLRRGDADRDTVDIGLDLLVDAGGGGFGIGADQEARGYQHAVILRLGVNMFHPIDALDDGFERLADEFRRIARGKAGRGHADIHHRHADLRLFLARDGEGGDQADDDRRQQEQRRQRRGNGGAGDPPGNAQR